MDLIIDTEYNVERVNDTFIISDTHFFHGNMVHLCNRPVNFNHLIIENWKKIVSDSDTIIHLGDVIFKQKQKLYGLMHNLPGRKILTLGNHDTGRYGKNPNWFYNCGFNTVSTYFIQDNILFSHVPVDLNKLEFFNPQDPDIKLEIGDIKYNVHGHFHNTYSSYTRCSFYDFNKHILYCPEEMNYMPVKLNDLIEYRLKNPIYGLTDKK